MSNQEFIEKIESAISNNNPFRYLNRRNYVSDKRTKSIEADGKRYAVFTESDTSNNVLYRFRKDCEERWNDSFTVIKYAEDRITHSMAIHNKLKEKLNLEKLANDKITGTKLENKLIIQEIPKDLISAKEFSKESPKTLSRYIAEDLAKIHKEGLAFRDPSICTLGVSPGKQQIVYSNFVFTQPIDKPEDKARDIMQFLISIAYNSGKSVNEITKIFSIYYKNGSNRGEGIRKAMENVIEYDKERKILHPKKTVYQWTVFGIGQTKMLRMKEQILDSF